MTKKSGPGRNRSGIEAKALGPRATDAQYLLDEVEAGEVLCVTR